MLIATMLFMAAGETAVPRAATIEIVEALDRELRDPESLTGLTICEPRQTDEGWTTWISYRARNGYGGYGRQAALVIAKGDEIAINTSLARMRSLRDVYAKKLEEARACNPVTDEEITEIRNDSNA